MKHFRSLNNNSSNCKLLLSARDLNFTYPGGIDATVNISLDFSPGLFGLLGPNGAGKTTLVKMLAGTLLSDSGTIEYDLGSGPKNIQKNILSYQRYLGYLPQECGFYPEQTARKMLDYYCLLKGICAKKERKGEIERVIELTGLTSAADVRTGEFSGGMKRRLGVAQSLLGSPRFLILDEPTTGMDPYEKSRFFGALTEISSTTVVLLLTHIVEDVSAFCEQFAILNRGQIIAKAKPTAAINSLNGKIWEVKERRFIPKNVIPTFTKYRDGIEKGRFYSEKQTHPESKSSSPMLEDYYHLAIANHQNLEG